MLFGSRKAVQESEKDNTKNKEKERKRTLRYRPFSVLLGCCRRCFEKVFFCTCPRCLKRASLAIETAAVIPVFLLSMLAVLSLMEFPALESVHLQRLCETAEIQGLEQWGEAAQETLTFTDSWSYVPIGGLLPLPAVPRSLTIQVHPWNGGESGENSGGTAEEMVVVTEHGTVYHTDPSCRHLHVDVLSASGGEVSNLRNNRGESYHACEQCSYRQQPASVVYMAPTGNRYHNSAGCGSLQRTNCLVPLSQVEGRRECLTCQRKHQ